ncbi:MAG: winged helix-turn-helix transcriptional regulator [Acidobacteriales bacterium]|nr:winged helix-turn-helix transcriptional regulator [Terriglobales bacterium]
MPSSTANAANDEVLSAFLHAIGDPKRRQILQLLKDRGGSTAGKEIGLSASEIEQRVGLSQPTVSHHMAILSRAGLVEGRKLGQWVWYRRREPALRAALRQLKEAL